MTTWYQNSTVSYLPRRNGVQTRFKFHKIRYVRLVHTTNFKQDIFHETPSVPPMYHLNGHMGNDKSFLKLLVIFATACNPREWHLLSLCQRLCVTRDITRTPFAPDSHTKDYCNVIYFPSNINLVKYLYVACMYIVRLQWANQMTK